MFAARHGGTRRSAACRVAVVCVCRSLRGRSVGAVTKTGTASLSRSNDTNRRLAGMRRALCFALALLCAAATAATPGIDERAPDFALKSSTGKNVRLSEFRGDVVLVNFWTRSCSRCKEQLDQVGRLLDEFQGRGFSVVSVAITDEHHHVQEVADALRLGFPILYDDEKRAARLYDPQSIPLTLIIDAHGNIRHLHERYERGDEAAYREQIVALLGE